MARLRKSAGVTTMPKLYTRFVNTGVGLRIIYPNGVVEFCHLNKKGDWSYSCLSRNTQASAIKAMHKYDNINGYEKAKRINFK